MSSIIEEFGLGLTEHLPALTLLNKLQETYFSSVIYAPTFYLLLGNELSSLNNLIHDVVYESVEGRFSMSAIFRNDNKSAAQKAVQLVFNGMDSSLESLEETLRGLKADRCATEEAWRLWGREVRDNGGEAGLRRALEVVKYHNWEISVVIKRTLKRDEIESLLLTAPVTCQYLINLFTELLSSTGAREFPSELISKFTMSASLSGKAFPADVPIEKLLKISIYWTFKAVSSIEDNARTSQTLSGEDAIALSKAYWIFEMCRGLINGDIREFKAVLAVIANELAFAAKTLLESQIGFPPFELLPKYGDFQIWLNEDKFKVDASRVEMDNSHHNYVESDIGIDCTSSGPWELPVSMVTDVRNYGARIGEDEILNRRLLASKSYSPEDARWEECGVRVFRTRSTGELRVLTLWDEGPPKILVVKPGEAELVPEYGYHMQKDLPVIFIRKTSEWGSSLQWGKRPKSTKKMTPNRTNTYFRFKKIEDMLDFQCAFLNENVLADIRTISAVRYKCGFLDGPTSTNFCRVQIWREVEYNSLIRSGTPSPDGFPVANYRGRPKGWMLRPKSSRVIIFLGRELLTIFITDDITIDEGSNNHTVKIKPMSYGPFGGRKSVKARIAGDRDLPGGIRLDRGGIMIEDEDGFDDLKWLEIEFESSSDMTIFIDNFKKELLVRRKERIEIDKLKKKAASGVRSSGR